LFAVTTRAVHLVYKIEKRFLLLVFARNNIIKNLFYNSTITQVDGAARELLKLNGHLKADHQNLLPHAAVF